MKITLKKLHMENFKNAKDQTFELDHITKIKGQNASGKTTIVDAFMWCLFNKDSKGNTDFGIRPLDAAGNKVDHVEIKVDLLLDVDGREYQITKVQKQNWVKKRGNLEARVFIRSLVALVNAAIKSYSFDDISYELLNTLFALEKSNSTKREDSNIKASNKQKEQTEKSVEDAFKEFIEIFGKAGEK